MLNIRTYTDIEDCERLWKKLWPAQCFFDLWPVRHCFQRAFNRPLCFRTFEINGTPIGMVALSWIAEKGEYVQFPGETWHGKTWIEQNRIVSNNDDTCRALLGSVPEGVHLRYLNPDPAVQSFDGFDLDEIGYLFLPGQYQYSFDRYFGTFSGKSRKKITAELSKFEKQAVTFRYDQIRDIDFLFRMNLDIFGSDSYFSDPRFFKAFENLIDFMVRNQMIRITTVLIGNEIAAVDIGAVFNNTYTVLAGGANPEFKGVAKLINLHHISWACSQKFDVVDFLCGDFNWKERFHLTPRPLYEIKRQASEIPETLSYAEPRIKICA